MICGIWMSSLCQHWRMFTRIKSAIGRATRGGGTRLRAPDGTTWRLLGAHGDGAFAAQFGKLADLAASPEASEAAAVADQWLAAFRDRRAGTLESAPAAARLLRRQGRTADLAGLQAHYPVPAGRLARPEVVAGAVGVAWEVVAEPGMPARSLAATAAVLQWLLDSYEFRGAVNPATGFPATGFPTTGTPVRKETVRHVLAVARLRQRRPQEVPSLCVRALASRSLSGAERATVLATLAMARQQLGQPCADLLDQARALDPGADLVAEANRVAEAVGSAPVSDAAAWPLW